MVLGIGSDLVDIARIKKLFEKYGDKFLHHVYTVNEIHYCQTKRDPVPSLAARFAAKEAISKAFGTGIGEQFHWKSAEILNDANGAPNVQLDTLGTALLKKLGGTVVKITLSHTPTLAKAVAIIS